jgi:hypothetical protein
LKNFILFLVAVLFGAVFNSLVLNLGMKIIPPPEGFDMNNPSELAKAMKVMEVRHFVFPFLAHALGTLLGVICFTYFSRSNKLLFPMLIAGLFFAGGLYMVIILPAPIWFNLVDLVLAYFPMAIIGFKLAKRKD